MQSTSSEYGSPNFATCDLFYDLVIYCDDSVIYNIVMIW